MKYNKFIGSNNNFQTSVNLQYDLNKEEKIRGYIPTTQSLSILKRYLNAVCSDNNNEDNATVLIGPYGRGKSHLLLVLSAILSHNSDSPVIAEMTNKLTTADSSVGELLSLFYSKNKPYLPIIINSNHTDINQSFIIALRESLERNDLNDFFPETYFDSALRMIKTWEKDFENAIKLFKKELRNRKLKLSDLKDQLNKCSASAYHTFCDIYPVVSNGASFNPLQNTDVVKMYEQVCDALMQQKSFGGVYIIFDEFSKFLESSAAMSNMQNLKLIQDFAEMAVRSNKMHLCCITHKEILDYSQSDSFRTVDGRFKKVYFVASSEQSYELVSNAITHGEKFDKFYNMELSFQRSVCDDSLKLRNILGKIGSTKYSLKNLSVESSAYQTKVYNAEKQLMAAKMQYSPYADISVETGGSTDRVIFEPAQGGTFMSVPQITAYKDGEEFSVTDFTHNADYIAPEGLCFTSSPEFVINCEGFERLQIKYNVYLFNSDLIQLLVNLYKKDETIAELQRQIEELLKQYEEQEKRFKEHIENNVINRAAIKKMFGKKGEE